MTAASDGAKTAARPGAEPGALLVADSFRVRVNPRTGAAEVRGLDEHLDRFRRSVLAQMPSAEKSDAEAETLERIDLFLDEALHRIAEYGEGFPRLELWGSERTGGDSEFALSLRPLPALGDTIELRSAPGVLLERPYLKGPNIPRLAELNRELGAEALLLDAIGCAVEGATTSLIWWTDDTDQSGHYIAEERARDRGNRVESVTEGLLRQAAQQRLVGRKPEQGRTSALTPARPKPAELARAEIWAVNALHGIRVVASVDGAPAPAPVKHRLRWFREALDRTWQPVAP
ncbi:aminotransferase class IV [Leucobacter tenebrionis]|uniref:aminotransferase class IV n=1 Tax=Leucobacter tenebrionis TaxID=2873270 RepID=UPI001CA60766|nr:aminotransferase class IV [Leucobacter tenebrionis]QZY52281.1 aminotransferase class IV [Leucobacter tenebrionis]